MNAGAGAVKVGPKKWCGIRRNAGTRFILAIAGSALDAGARTAGTQKTKSNRYFAKIPSPFISTFSLST
jgi:hypothetical protein